MGSEVEESLTPEEKLRGAITGKMPWSYPVECAKCNQLVNDPIYFKGKPYHLTHLPKEAEAGMPVTPEVMREYYTLKPISEEAKNWVTMLSEDYRRTPEGDILITRADMRDIAKAIKEDYLDITKDFRVIEPAIPKAEAVTPVIPEVTIPTVENLKMGQTLIDGAGDRWTITNITKDGRYTIKAEGYRGLTRTTQVRELERFFKIEQPVPIPKAEAGMPEGGGTMESYLVSGKCETVLEDLQAGRVPCWDWRKTRQAAACYAWSQLGEKKVPWGQALREGFAKVREKCSWTE